jgi:hypothetical protein
MAMLVGLVVLIITRNSIALQSLDSSIIESKTKMHRTDSSEELNSISMNLITHLLAEIQG